MQSIFIKIKSALLKFFVKNSIAEQKKVITLEKTNPILPKERRGRKTTRKKLTLFQTIKIKQLLIAKRTTQKELANNYRCRHDFLNAIINGRRKATPRFFQLIEELKTK